MKALSVVLPLVVGLELFGSGCSEPGGGERLVVQDSSGVRVVSYAGGISSAPTLTVSDEPRFIYGEVEGDYLFGNVRFGALLENGSAVVADLQNREIVVIDSTGDLRSVVGASGEGPGEIGSIRSLVVLPDETIVVEDGSNARFGLFQMDGPIGTVSKGDMGDLARLNAVGAGSDGRLIMATQGYRSLPETQWLEGSIVNVDLSTLEVDTIADYDFFKRPSDGPAQPFRPMGEVVVAGDAVVVGRSDRPELEWLDEEGRLFQKFHWVPERRLPTESFWDAFEEAYVPVVGGRMSEQDINRQLAEWKSAPPEELPLYGPIMGSSNGEVYLAEYTPGTDIIAHFNVVSSVGEPLGRVEMPDGFRLLDISENQILGVIHDAVGVQMIAIYDLGNQSIR